MNALSIERQLRVLRQQTVGLDVPERVGDVREQRLFRSDARRRPDRLFERKVRDVSLVLKRIEHQHVQPAQ